MPPPSSPAAAAKGAPKGKSRPAKKSATKAPREQSTIAFPYQDLEQAISVARAILDNGGGSFTREQLAGAMKLSPTSGNFVLKTLSARLFGLVEGSDGKRQLTPLGYAILDSTRQKAARAQAFLNVPLYRKLYDEFKGKQLPPRPHGLENAIIKAGVVETQRANARLIFDKAAAQAGFYAMGQDRLIEPIIGGSAPPIDRGPPDDGGRGRGSHEAPEPSDEFASLHPFIRGLLDTLPAPDTTWTVEGRAKWLQAAAHCFDLIYKGDGSIQITAKSPPASEA